MATFDVSLRLWSYVPVLLGQTSDGTAPSAVQVQSVWDFLVKGGPMMVPIGLCSLVALTVIVERLVSLRRGAVITPGLLEDIGRLLDEDEEDGRGKAIERCREDDSPLGRVCLVGIRKLDSPEQMREKHIEEAGEREVFKLRKYLRVLTVIAALAPVLGLLGTVFGMIKAFQTVAVSGEALGKTELLAKGIYEALITTAAGLLLAVPVLISYHWIQSRVETLVREMDGAVVDFFEGHALGAAAARRVVPRLAESPSENSEEVVTSAGVPA